MIVKHAADLLNRDKFGQCAGLGRRDLPSVLAQLRRNVLQPQSAKNVFFGLALDVTFCTDQSVFTKL